MGGVWVRISVGSSGMRPSRRQDPREKTRGRATLRLALLNLRFFEDDVLADDRVVLLELELVRGVLLVLGRRVEETGIGSRHQLDLFAFFLLGHRRAP